MKHCKTLSNYRRRAHDLISGPLIDRGHSDYDPKWRCVNVDEA